MPNTLVVMSFASPLPEPKGVDIYVRRSDWAMSPLQKKMSLLLDAVRLSWAARRYERVILVTGGLELFVVCLLLRKTRIEVVDWLIPRSERLDRSGLLGRVDRFHVIRRADAATLTRRFGVAPERCRFTRFPAPGVVVEQEHQDEGFFYSAGWAHRDWPTLLAALRDQPHATVISSGQHLDVPDCVTLLEQQSPDEGRRYLRRARCMVLPLMDTELPSGPLVLLDAMAHGKPVIVSAVGGSVDYVTDGVSAVMVPPGDPRALAEAIHRVESDPDLRKRLSAGALEQVRGNTPERFWRDVLDPVLFAGHVVQPSTTSI